MNRKIAETIYVENCSDDPKFPISLLAHLEECPKCKRKIFVSLPLIGTCHHLSATPICAECMDLNDPTTKKFTELLSPEDLEKLKNYIKS